MNNYDIKAPLFYGALNILAWAIVLGLSTPSSKPAKRGFATLGQGTVPDKVICISPTQTLSLQHKAHTYWLDVQTSSSKRRYIAQADKAKKIFNQLASLQAKPLALNTSENPSFKLSAKQRHTLKIEYQGKTQTIFLGAQTFGQRGFYVQIPTRPKQVFVVDAPELRWLIFGQAHLPENRVSRMHYNDIRSISATYRQQQTLTIEQKQLDTPEYAYWQWKNRPNGASRIARRWVKALKRLRSTGPLRQKTEIKNANALFDLTITSNQGQKEQMRAILSKDGRVYLTNTWLSGDWVELQSKLATRFDAFWPNLYEASKHETLYNPPDPNQPAHHGHHDHP